MGCWLSGPWSDQTVSGRSLTHLSQRDAMQILAAAQHPITMQIKSQRRGQKTDHVSTWEPLPLGLQHLNLPRSFYSQLPVPKDCDPHFGFMSSSPRDTLELDLQDPELSHARKQLSHAHKEPSCLSCCGSNTDEPLGFSTAQDEDDFLLDKPLGFLPLHHELDSGLGWTDGSVHQGELSGLETEEGGVDECLPRGGLTAGGCAGLGGSPSSESFISSELSDSGFYSVSTVEFRHFQRLLEKRMRLYNARLQNEAYDRSERRDSCPKSHLLEAIPESLPVRRPQDNLPVRRPQDNLPLLRPDSLNQPPCPQHGPEPELPQRGLFRVSSVQFHKSDRPSLNRHSSSSGALFNPAHSVMSRLNAPILSTCSTPSSHRRALLPHGPQQQNGAPLQPLRRSRTLHYRPPQAEYRRRASHPASPSYYTLHQCSAPTAAAMLELPHMHNDHSNMAHCYDANANYEQYWRERSEHSRSIPDNLLMERERERHEREMEHQRLNQMEEHQRIMEREREQHLLKQKEMEREREREQQRASQKDMEQKRISHRELEQKLEQEQRRLQQLEVERERQMREEREERERGERERQEREEKVRQSLEFNRRRFRENNSSFSQSGEANDTWPKPNTRNLQHNGGSRGMYSTLDGPAGSASGGRSMCGALEGPAGSASGGRSMCGALEGPAGSASGGRSMCGALEGPAGSASGGRSMCGALEGPAGSASGGRSMCGALEGPAGSASSSWDMQKAQSNTTPSAKLAQKPMAVSRVSRSQLLRHRASQLADERSGMSTDEETGDMLLGRYWSRTERKEHFLLARELRQARGDRSSSRERERAGTVPEDPRASTVLELSHRKLSRLRNRKLLDDWTTVEELLTHGNRLDNTEDALTCPSSLLTVTTV
ncbi:uncharacterized protein [Eucyclogobius newberryi]|uniref:uncharacterized protein isoform X2 n=1 Tax=Eucyclogobius newberryi TaxID=166745 RepID=UPI003B59C9A5